MPSRTLHQDGGSTSLYYQQQYDAELRTQTALKRSSSSSKSARTLIRRRHPSREDLRLIEPKMESTMTWVSNLISPTRPAFPQQPQPPSSSASETYLIRRNPNHTRNPSTQEVRDRLRNQPLPPTPDAAAVFGAARTRPQPQWQQLDRRHAASASIEYTRPIVQATTPVRPPRALAPQPLHHHHQHTSPESSGSSIPSSRNPSPLTPPASPSVLASYYDGEDLYKPRSPPPQMPLRSPPTSPRGPPPSAFSTRAVRKSVIAKISEPVSPSAGSTPGYVSALGSMLASPSALEELGISDSELERVSRERERERESRGRRGRGAAAAAEDKPAGDWIRNKVSQVRSKSLGRSEGGRRRRSPSDERPPLPPPKPQSPLSPRLPTNNDFKRPPRPTPSSPHVLYHVDFMAFSPGDPNPPRPSSVAFSDISIASTAMTAGGTRYNIKNKALRVVNTGGYSSPGSSGASVRSSTSSSIGSTITALLHPIMSHPIMSAPSLKPRSSLRRSPTTANPLETSTPTSFNFASSLLLPSPTIRSIPSVVPNDKGIIASDVRRVLETLSTAYEEDEDDVWRTLTSRFIQGEDDDDDAAISLESLMRVVEPPVAKRLPRAPLALMVPRRI